MPGAILHTLSTQLNLENNPETVGDKKLEAWRDHITVNLGFKPEHAPQLCTAFNLMEPLKFLGGRQYYYY